MKMKIIITTATTTTHNSIDYDNNKIIDDDIAIAFDTNVKGKKQQQQ